MLRAFSRAKAASGSCFTENRRSISGFRDSPEIREKVEAVKAEVASEVPDALKEKVLKAKEEVEAEMAGVLKSMGLELEALNPNQKDVAEETHVPDENLEEKLEKLNQEITKKIEEVVRPPEISSMLELLKVETAKASQTHGLTEAILAGS